MTLFAGGRTPLLPPALYFVGGRTPLLPPQFFSRRPLEIFWRSKSVEVATWRQLAVSSHRGLKGPPPMWPWGGLFVEFSAIGRSFLPNGDPLRALWAERQPRQPQQSSRSAAPCPSGAREWRAVLLRRSRIELTPYRGIGAWGGSYYESFSAVLRRQWASQ